MTSIAHLAQRAEHDRFLDVADLPWVDTLDGDGWIAIRTRADSNDLNGVLSHPGTVPSRAEIDRITSWLGQFPSTWHSPEASALLTARLESAGWQPECTAHAAGGELPKQLRESPSDVIIACATEDTGIDTWLDIAEACGWFDSPRDREIRRRLAQSLPWPRWVASLDGTPVGIATARVDGAVVELVDIAVVKSAQRRGIGTALLQAVLDEAPDAKHLVTAPSPDGWELLKHYGFENVDLPPETSFYWQGLSRSLSEAKPRRRAAPRINTPRH